MERTQHFTFLAVCVACGLVATSTFAQGQSEQRATAGTPAVERLQPPAHPSPSSSSFPDGEWAVGWSFVHPYHSDGHNVTEGFDSSGVVAVNRWLGVVLFDVSVNHDDGRTSEALNGGQTTAAVLGGARFALRRSRLVVPYAQVVVGYGRTSVSVSGTGESVAQGYFVLQPGVGVDIGGERLAARIEFSVRRSYDELVASTGFRLVLGLVIRTKPASDDGHRASRR
jgi:hypothetical protein